MALTLDESGPYAYAVGDTLYYGMGSGSFEVWAAMTDERAGLEQVVFPPASSPGRSYALGGVASASHSHVYTFTTASAFAGAVTVVAADRAGNLASGAFAVVHDVVPPRVWLSAPLRYAGETPRV